MFKRAFFSLKFRWKRVLGHVLAYTLLFALCFGAIVLYTTVRGQQEFLQGALSRSVTVAGVEHYVHVIRENTGAISADPKPEDWLPLTEDDAVDGWNIVQDAAVHFVGQQIVYPEERAKSIEDHHYGQAYRVHEDGTQVLAVRDSARSKAFLLSGMNLIEGEHFSGDDPGDVVLISQEFAELNGLHVGDKLQAVPVQDEAFYEPFSLEWTVSGIFASPETDMLKGFGARPEEIVVVPISTWQDIAKKDPKDYIYFVTFFLKEGEDVDAFIEKIGERMNVQEVVDDYYGTHTLALSEEMMGMSWEEIIEYVEANPDYVVRKESQWYDRVAAPIEQQVKVAGVMMWMLLGVVVLIITLTTALTMKERYREIGILLSMGESKAKVAGQLTLEALAPLVLALGLGVLIGTVAGVPLAENLCNGAYQETADVAQAENNVASFHYTSTTYEEQDPWLLNERSLTLSLALDYPDELEVYPQTAARVEPEALVSYMAVLLGVALLAVVGQGLVVMRAKPARILLNRR